MLLITMYWRFINYKVGRELNFTRKSPEKSVPIGLLSTLDRVLLGRDDGNRSNLSAVPTKSNDDVIGSNKNSKYSQKIDALNRNLTRGQYTSRVEEGEQQSQRKNKARDTEQKKGTETMAHHEDHIKSAFLPQKIPHEVGVSEGKDEREQQDIPKVDPALHNHFLEFLSSAKATTAAASSLPSSSNEEIAEGKSIRTNLSECKKVIKYLLRCLQGIKLSVENDGDIKSKVKTNH